MNFNMNYNDQVNDYNPSGLRKHMLKTYTWMMLGVCITFLVAAIAAASNLTIYLLYNVPFYSIIMLVAQIGIVIALSRRVMKASYTSTVVLFLIYSILMGMTMSVYAYIFEIDTIVVAFLAAGVYFASLVVIGSTTKADLSKIGTLCIAGLFAMIIFTLFSFIFSFSVTTLLYSVFGLLIFTGLTAWDAQKAKRLYMQYEGDAQMVKTLGIYSALELYLDFINIFIYILRIIGNRN